ncbi:hypothetical protein AC1031_014864 [Aphanomyces cochlioides]|nr:hypothetical protein AC1031_014864 [Aphanomyces cochlioides]
MECWRFLSEKPKWEVYRSTGLTKRGIKKHASDESEGLSTIDDRPTLSSETLFLDRPKGVKSSKRKKKMHEKLVPHELSLAKATSDMAAAMERKAHAQTIVANMQLFTMSTDTLTPIAKRFVELQQAEVLADLEARALKRQGATNNKDNLGREASV